MRNGTAFMDFVFEQKLQVFAYTLAGTGETKNFFYLFTLRFKQEILLYCAKKKYRNLIKEASSHGVVLKLHDCIRNRVMTFKYYGVIEYL